MCNIFLGCASMLCASELVKHVSSWLKCCSDCIVMQPCKNTTSTGSVVQGSMPTLNVQVLVSVAAVHVGRTGSKQFVCWLELLCHVRHCLCRRPQHCLSEQLLTGRRKAATLQLHLTLQHVRQLSEPGRPTKHLSQPQCADLASLDRARIPGDTEAQHQMCWLPAHSSCLSMHAWQHQLQTNNNKRRCSFPSTNELHMSCTEGVQYSTVPLGAHAD